MDRDDGLEARLAVMHELDQLVFVEVRLGPESHRARLFNLLLWQRKKAWEWGE